MISTDVMGYPLNDAGIFILDVEASDVGIGGVIHQVQNDRERVIAYDSRLLKKSRKKLLHHRKRVTSSSIFYRIFQAVSLG